MASVAGIGWLGSVYFLHERGFGLTVTFILTLVLVTIELLRAHGGSRARRVASVSMFASLPLLAVFVAVVVSRFLFAMGKL